MAARSCPRCRKNHLGSLGFCERCRTEVTEDYLAGPSAIPELLAVVKAARAVLTTSPMVTAPVHRELAAALDAFDRARSEDAQTRPGTPSAREGARSRS